MRRKSRTASIRLQRLMRLRYCYSTIHTNGTKKYEKSIRNIVNTTSQASAIVSGTMRVYPYQRSSVETTSVELLSGWRLRITRRRVSVARRQTWRLRYTGTQHKRTKETRFSVSNRCACRHTLDFSPERWES